MANKNRRKDSKDSAQKNTLNPASGGSASSHTPPGVPPEGNPRNPTNDREPEQRIGQFTGRGAPGLQKK